MAIRAKTRSLRARQCWSNKKRIRDHAIYSNLYKASRCYFPNPFTSYVHRRVELDIEMYWYGLRRRDLRCWSTHDATSLKDHTRTGEPSPPESSTCYFGIQDSPSWGSWRSWLSEWRGIISVWKGRTSDAFSRGWGQYCCGRGVGFNQCFRKSFITVGS